MIAWIETGDAFPPITAALTDPNGLLAASPTLQPDDIISAYRSGIFPWCSPEDPVLWWSPDPRMILIPHQIRIRRSLKKRIRNADYRIRINGDFESVMRHCAMPRKTGKGTWIAQDFLEAYGELHRRQIAHSIEILVGNRLVGGLYGLSMGRVFFGESMFSIMPDASKIALAFLCFVVGQHPNGLIDCQVSNAHLQSMGAIDIPRSKFIDKITALIDQPATDWTMASDLFFSFRQELTCNQPSSTDV